MVKLHTDLRRSVGFLAAKMTKTPHSAESIFPSLLGPGGENDPFLIISHQVPGNSVYFEHQNCDKHPEFWIQLAKGTPQYILHIYYYYFIYYIYIITIYIITIYYIYIRVDIWGETLRRDFVATIQRVTGSDPTKWSPG